MSLKVPNFLSTSGLWSLGSALEFAVIEGSSVGAVCNVGAVPLTYPRDEESTVVVQLDDQLRGKNCRCVQEVR